MNKLQPYTPKPQKISRYHNQLKEESSQYGDYIAGWIETPYGYVKAFSDATCADLRFIYQGYLHYRSFQRGFSKGGLMIQTRKFVEEIANKADS